MIFIDPGPYYNAISRYAVEQYINRVPSTSVFMKLENLANTLVN